MTNGSTRGTRSSEVNNDLFPPPRRFQLATTKSVPKRLDPVDPTESTPETRQQPQAIPDDHESLEETLDIIRDDDLMRSLSEYEITPRVVSVSASMSESGATTPSGSAEVISSR